MVVSKVPLPNYRPDLDDKRPQREVLTSRSFSKTFYSMIFAKNCYFIE